MTGTSLLAALAGAMVAGQDAGVHVTPDAPCGVYLEGEALAFAVGGDATGLAFTAVDYDGVEVATATPADGRLVLPDLAAGYYDLTWDGGKLSFAVVAARPDTAPPEGPLAVDAASAWLCSPEQWEPLARMLRRIGIGWVRERISWGEVEPEEGKLAWGKYETVAEALHSQGLREYQIFHDSPWWTRPGRETRCPDDLRTVYRFTKAAAAHFAGRIHAWEPWNEPDIFFFDQLGDRYAGVQKAAYLGLKAGDPGVIVLECSLCRGKSDFSDNIHECGVADYADVFNFHTYAPLSAYVDNIRSWVALAAEYGVGDRPIWLTEAGVHLLHTDLELTPERERTQAEFVPRSFAISLAGGVDRHFFFVLPFYPEGAVQFGALHRDLSPRPSLVAIATAVRLLGEGRYLGRLACEPEACQCYVFDSGSGLVAVAWADSAATTAIPVAADAVTVVDLIGRAREVAAEGERVSLTVGPSAQYIIGLGDGVRERLEGTVRPPGRFPELAPSKIIIVGHPAEAPIDKDRNYYSVRANAPMRFQVEVYNFDEHESTEGDVSLVLPEGWAADRNSATVRLEPMGREVLWFEITPRGRNLIERQRILVSGDFAGPRVAPSVSHVMVDVTQSEPVRRLEIGLADVGRWLPGVSGNGTATVEATGEGAIAFIARFTAPGDRWCYPQAWFEEVQDWSEYDGLAFEYRFDTDDKGTTCRAQFIEASGAHYVSEGWEAATDWRRAVCLFARASWGSFSPADPSGMLDRDRITGILIGLNTALDNVRLEVRNVELVGY